MGVGCSLGGRDPPYDSTNLCDLLCLSRRLSSSHVSLQDSNFSPIVSLRFTSQVEGKSGKEPLLMDTHQECEGEGSVQTKRKPGNRISLPFEVNVIVKDEKVEYMNTT